MHNISPLEYKIRFNISKLIDLDISEKISKVTAGENNPMYGTDRSGDKAPNFGRVWSKEHNEKISQTRVDRGLSAGKNNPMYGKKHKKETKELNSLKACERVVAGFYEQKRLHHKKGYYFSNKNNKDIWYDSSYELKALQILEENSDVISFDRNKERIPYEYYGVIKNCLPDFYFKNIEGTLSIIEVKPQRILDKIEKESVKVQVMSNYYRDRNITFLVWTEKELGIV
jgi:hypothetical protein